MDDCVIPVIIPSYEPDERLLGLLQDLQRGKIGPVVIIDDGNSDEYRIFFEKAECQYHSIILRHDVNRGKGRALKTAFDFCLNRYSNMKGCITADSDGQHTMEAISRCKKALLNNPEHFILGVRNFQGGGRDKMYRSKASLEIILLKEYLSYFIKYLFQIHRQD